MTEEFKLCTCVVGLMQRGSVSTTTQEGCFVHGAADRREGEQAEPSTLEEYRKGYARLAARLIDLEADKYARVQAAPALRELADDLEARAAEIRKNGTTKFRFSSSSFDEGLATGYGQSAIELRAGLTAPASPPREPQGAAPAPVKAAPGLRERLLQLLDADMDWEDRESAMRAALTAVPSTPRCNCGADRTGPSAEAHLSTCPAAAPAPVKDARRTVPAPVSGARPQTLVGGSASGENAQTTAPQDAARTLREREVFEAGVMSRKDWWEAMVATYFAIFKKQPPETMKACDMSHAIVAALAAATPPLSADRQETPE